MQQPHWLTEKEERELRRTQRVQSDQEFVKDPTVQFGDLWYFYDETWSSLFGPFSNRKECREAMVKYAKSLK